MTAELSIISMGRHAAGFPALFERRAARAPDAVAVDGPDGQLSYGELRRRARLLARRLRARGAGPETAVGLLVERASDLLVGAIGILEAGAVYLPLDPAYPPARLARMLTDAGARCLVTHRGLGRRLARHGLEIVELERLDGADAGRSAVPVAPENAAYLVYTSGSTGEPKGVAIPHRALGWYCAASGEHYALTRDDRVLQLASIGFDVAIGEIFPTLAAGATLVLAGAGVDADFFSRCAERRITVLLPPTALWHELAALAAADPAAVPRSLRLVSFGGERVSASRLMAWRRRVGPRVRLVNGYGPSETTVEATIFDLTAEVRARDEDAAALIGRPVRGVRILVCDPALRPLPAGELGELCVAGPGLGRGYHRRPAATARGFVPNPEGDAPGERLYRTGDRVRLRADGNLEILGRLDRQVKIRGFRVEPGEVETELLREPEVGAAAVVPAGERRLAAFIVVDERAAPDAGAGILGVGRPDPVSADELARRLRERLPGYLVPSTWTLVEALPLTPHGKVDREALRRRQPASRVGVAASAYVAPRDRRERILARVWAEVLGLERVGIDDDFFALGGDSILAIQIVTRARRQGLGLVSPSLFEHPTIASLAASLDVGAAGTVAGSTAGGGTDATGEVPLTPVQCWFFDDARLPEPLHFNQSMLLRTREPVAPAALRRAVDEVVRHHDALRARFTRRATGGWRQTIPAAGAGAPVVEIDLSRLAPADAASALAAACGRLQASLDLERGPLVRCALFDLGPEHDDRLLVAIHHLVVDGVSWRILLEDLERVYRAGLSRPGLTRPGLSRLGLSRPGLTRPGLTRPGLTRPGRSTALPPETTSYRTWAELQTRLARSPELARELAYWRRAASPRRLPRDAGGANTYASVETVSMGLDAESTRRLLREAPAAYRTRINDLLLTALERTLVPWAGGPVTVDLEGHGREPLAIGDETREIDLSRTVGWFTATFPVRLDGVEEEPGAALVAVKERLRAIPRRGLGYGILRYLSDPETRAAIAALPAAEISFNYLGQLDALFAGSTLFAPASEPRGPERSRRGARPYPIEVDGGVVGGRLWINWQYSRALHRRSTIETLARAFLGHLETLIDHCLAPGAGGVTPSDFPLAGLDRESLARLAPGPGVEDLYPLSPLQQGMLFHALYAPGSAVYVEQASWALDGRLDVAAFEHAWDELVARHPILRTAFQWRGLERPLQRVERRVELEWRREDWRQLARAEQETRLETLLDADRERGFDLARAPLLRLALVRLGEESYRFLWSFHHALLDGWSIAALFEELFDLYRAWRRGADPKRAPRRPFRDYVAWLADQDRAEAEAFWRRELRGFDRLTPLGGEPARDGRDAPRRVATRERRLSSAATAALRRFARERRLTAATVLQGAWALLLARRSGRRDVVFGATVSGRPETLAGADTIVGLVINTLPVRVDVDPGTAVFSWLETLQRRGVALRRHGDAPLYEIERWCGVRPLFDSLLVYENFPADRPLEAEQRRSGLGIGGFRGYSHTNYPLTLGILPGPELSIEASYDVERFAPTDVERLLRGLETLLAAMIRHPERRLGDLSAIGLAERHQLLVEWNDGAACATGARGTTADDGARLFPRRFAAWAARTPDAVAVVEDAGGRTRVMSYGALARRATALARPLRGLGVGPEVRVGLALRRSAERIVAVLAVLEAGAAFVPLDPDLPAARRRRMLRRAEVGLVIDDAALSSLSGRRKIPPRSPLFQRGEARGAHRPLDNLAYVLHTSGSTGEPKGVMIPHRGLATILAAWERVYGLRPGDRHLQAASFTFDVATGDLVRALGTGGTLVLRPRAALVEPETLDETLRRHRIDVVELVPAVAASLARRLDPAGSADARARGPSRELRSRRFDPAGSADARPRGPSRELRSRRFDSAGSAGARPRGAPRTQGHAFPRVRLLAVGSDRWPLGDHRLLARLCGPATRLVNSYGVTEATIDSTFFEGPAAGPDGGATPIGRPFPGTAAHVVDRRLRPVPIGVAGELVLTGPGLARGYAGRPALTAERFLPDPFAESAGARVYRTGDLARRRPDGVLDVLGRVDRELKVRGVRIAPEEIEAALGRHPEIASAAVVALPDGHPAPARRTTGAAGKIDPGDSVRRTTGAADGHASRSRGDSAASLPRLVAWLVPRDGVAPEAAELRRFLARELPPALIPTRFAFLDALPTNRAGKVDRDALGRLASPSPERSVSYRPPASATERALAAIWRRVLEVDRVGRDDDFFALGGHSLRALRLAAEVERRLGARLPLARLFECSTLETLAAAIDRPPRADRSPLVSIAAGNGRPPFFCVHPVGGEVLCYAELARRLDPDQPVYGLRADGNASAEDTVPAMARRYLDAIRDRQPRGPYRLGGWSMGGAVAYEIARLLTEEGEEVALLAVIDCAAPGSESAAEIEDLSGLAAFAQDLGLPPGDPAASETLRSILNRGRRLGILDQALELAELESLYRRFRINDRALRRYRPGTESPPPSAGRPSAVRPSAVRPSAVRPSAVRPSAGRPSAGRPSAGRPSAGRPPVGSLVLFRTRDWNGGDLTLGWRDLARRVDVRILPGDHFSILRAPVVGELAAELRRRIG